MIESITSNYFERGKHGKECHDNYNDTLYKQNFANLHASNGYIVKFTSSACNYYERGGAKCPLYFQTTKTLQVPTDYVHWYTLVCCNTFIYKMPMHRKEVRLRCYLIHVPWCVLLNIFIDLITPWDPGIFLSRFLPNNEKGRINKHHSHYMCP